MNYPWLEWNKSLTEHTQNLLSCPFCCQKHLNLTVGFDGKAARVTCRHCLANGPWATSLDKTELISEAQSKWNGMQRGVYDARIAERGRVRPLV